MKEINRNLVLRTVSAVALAPPLAAAVLWRRPEAVGLVVNVAALIALLELNWIVLRDDPPWLRVAGALLGCALSAVMVWLPRPELVIGVLVLATVASTILHLLRFDDIRQAAVSSALMLFGILYVPFLLTSLALLKRMPDGADWVMLVLTITFFSDTGAYATGRLFGKHKLYAAVSPGKTIEGALGGLCAAFGAAAVAKGWYMPQISWLDAALIAIPGGMLGQLGDLVESMIKRAFEVKDSGWIIPGHGGLLDRIDALIFVSAYTHLYAAHVFGRLG